MNNLFKKVENRIKGLHKARLINPHVHWTMLVQLFLVMALILIIFGFYLLYKIRNEQIFQTTPSFSSNPPSLIKEELLEKVTNSFKKKEILNKEIEAGSISFSDPS
jgi:hypothetical protein